MKLKDKHLALLFPKVSDLIKFEEQLEIWKKDPEVGETFPFRFFTNKNNQTF